MKNQILKNLAMNAKNRLINKNLEKGKLKNNNTIYSPNVKFRIISNEDGDFIARAKSLCEEDLFSPLKKLIDDNFFSKLDSYGREKYLFETIDKYEKFRSKVEKENENLQLLS